MVPSKYGTVTKANEGDGGCNAWERVECITMRAETEPESLLTNIEGLLRCPACGFRIDWGVNE